ncbi:hypothetical protein KUTeg_002958 [Tegillarca granosa]|uniref:Uncharacterized protein n=1 Tax=Tegillarca granosa TaxID=220873 RepID=A0ABQ9FMK6_TEGGR|nr:hypothetical protein KUTeg_002958 [Tegillarca granosa]
MEIALNKEAKNLIEAAEKIGLVGINYVWILTSTSIGSITKRTSSYPLGTLDCVDCSYVRMFSVTFARMEDDNEEDNNVIKSIVSSIRVWAKALFNS